MNKEKAFPIPVETEASPEATDDTRDQAVAEGSLVEGREVGPRPISSMEINVGAEGIVLSTVEGDTEYTDNELQLFRPVFEYIQEKVSSISELEHVLHAMEQKNQTLPFWFQESFPIVLREILINSIRAVQEREGVDGRIDVKSFIDDAGKDFVISVIDNGIGLQKQSQANVFRRGHTTKQTSAKGLVGNGLYRSKAFVEEILGGSIEIFDNENETGMGSGATCNIRIPLNN